MPPPYSFHSMDSIMPRCVAVLDEFHVVTKPELIKIIFSMNKTTCELDSFLTKLLFSHLNAIIDLFRHIVNLSLTAGVFPTPCKTSIVRPLIKRLGLDPEVLKNYRPVSNLRFVSKIIEKIISVRLLDSCGTLCCVYIMILLLLLEKAIYLLLFYLIYLLPLTQLILILCLSCWRSMSESPLMHYSW